MQFKYVPNSCDTDEKMLVINYCEYDSLTFDKEIENRARMLSLIIDKLVTS